MCIRDSTWYTFLIFCSWDLMPCAYSTGAEMVSRYCQDAGDWKGAIEFMLTAKRTTDAFNLAKSHGQMDVFTKVRFLCVCH